MAATLLRNISKRSTDTACHQLDLKSAGMFCIRNAIKCLAHHKTRSTGFLPDYVSDKNNK